MIAHYLRVTMRTLARQKLHTCLAITVLTLGLTCFIGCAVFVLYLDTFDSQFRSSERIHVVYEGVSRPPSQDVRLRDGSSPKLKAELELLAPELEAVARAALAPRGVTVEGSEPQMRRVAFADAAWAELFELESVVGAAPSDVLSQPRGAIVTEPAARLLFGDEPAIGKTLSIADALSTVEVTVGAVVKETPAPSHLATTGVITGATGWQIAASWSAYEVAMPIIPVATWGQIRTATTYAVLPADGSLTLAELNRRLQLLAERASAEPRPAPLGQARVSFEARHVSRLIKDRLQVQLEGAFSNTELPLPVTTILLGFAAVVLGIACLNFVNLATARAAIRAREVGVRKSLGASARHVIRQDLMQTAFTVVLALVLAVTIVWLSGRLVAERWQATLALPWPRPELWLLLGGLLVSVTAAAGAYPAAVLARIRPMTALRLGTARSGPRALRAVLVGVQFAAATLLVFAVIVFYLQTNAVRQAALDRFEDPIVVLPATVRFQGNTQANVGIRVMPFETLAAELRRSTAITGVAGTQRYPWLSPMVNGEPIRRSPGADAPGTSAIGVEWVTADYKELLEIPLVAGRWFADDRADEVPMGSVQTQRRAVLDTRAVRALGFASPQAAIGEIVYGAGGRGYEGPAEIIGVVGGSPLALRSSGAEDGFVYSLFPFNASVTLVRLDRSRVAEGLAHIRSVLEALAPGAVSGDPTFLDESFENAYATFNRVSAIVTALAAFAMAIAAVGLFAMATFMAARRTREIGLRKTQGATTRGILRLLLADFSKPVLLANIAVWPIAYVAARSYVNGFVDRIEITPLPFMLTLAATLLVAWLVISVQVLRAARVNPAVALRHE